MVADDRLTNRQIVRLAKNVSATHMALIALGYLDLDKETVNSLHYEYKDDFEAFNRDILRYWITQNPGPNQVKVTV